MDLAIILLIALSLSLDNLAVALAAGIETGEGRIRNGARIALAFGAFQAGMPILGWLAGRSVMDFISGFDHWIAFALLVVVGIRMILEGISGKGEGRGVSLDTASLLVLAVALAAAWLAHSLSRHERERRRLLAGGSS